MFYRLSHLSYLSLRIFIFLHFLRLIRCIMWISRIYILLFIKLFIFCKLIIYYMRFWLFLKIFWYFFSFINIRTLIFLLKMFFLSLTHIFYKWRLKWRNFRCFIWRTIIITIFLDLRINRWKIILFFVIIWLFISW